MAKLWLSTVQRPKKCPTCGTKGQVYTVGEYVRATFRRIDLCCEACFYATQMGIRWDGLVGPREAKWATRIGTVLPASMLVTAFGVASSSSPPVDDFIVASIERQLTVLDELTYDAPMPTMTEE